MSRRNLELKAPLQDIGKAIDTARSLGAADHGELRQVDTYFRASHGRLKLREVAGGGSELIFYDRSEHSPVRWSTYWVVPVDDAEAVKALLSAGLGIRGSVRKRRRLFIWQECRIHIDEVEELGSFIEFEVVASTHEAEARRHMSTLLAAFHVDERLAIAASYADLLGL